MVAGGIDSEGTLLRRLGLSLLVLGLMIHPLAAQAQTPSVGESAPSFTLNTPDGKPVTLSSLTKNGKLALIVLRGYPGYQCPFCVKQVHDFIENAGKFAAAGTQVLLIYPGPPADLDQHARDFLVKQNPLPQGIHLVTDPDYTVTNQYGLRWDAPHETAYPSTFLIDGKNRIFFRKVSKGHGDRSNAADVLAELRNSTASASGR
jgi:peroxiredoxin